MSATTTLVRITFTFFYLFNLVSILLLRRKTKQQFQLCFPII